MQALPEAGDMLFNLLVLHRISGTNGYVWQCSPEQLYIVEVVIPENDKLSKTHSISLLKMLPTIECHSPHTILHSEDSVPSKLILKFNKYLQSRMHSQGF